MLQKKICLLGAFGVGKTSLVRRFVDSIFSDAYLTTVGVKIDKKLLTVGSEQIALILWDIAGEDDIAAVRMSYLRGAAGYLLVIDGTRPETLDTARLDPGPGRCRDRQRPLPVACSTRPTSRRTGTSRWSGSTQLEAAGWLVRRTSAKTGAGVEETFQELAALLRTDSHARPAGADLRLAADAAARAARARASASSTTPRSWCRPAGTWTTTG